MALKMGKTAEEISELKAKKMNMLGQGDVTKKYSEWMMKLSPEDLAVDNKSKEALDRLIDSGKDKIVKIELSELSESPRNCYEKPQGEKREELKASLKSIGQINPIFVRPKECVEWYQEEIENSFEILIGHSRVELLKELSEETGITTADAIIVNCDDVQATLLISQSNIQREEVSDIELARAYKNTYEAMKKDKNANLKNVEISTDLSKSQSGTSDRTDEVVARKYGISKNTLRRKMALAYCSNKAVDFYNKKKFNQEQIQSISKLDEGTQDLICKIMWEEKIKMTNATAKNVLKVYEEEKKNPHLIGAFSINIMRDVLRSGQVSEEKEVKEKKRRSQQTNDLWTVSIKKKMMPNDIKSDEEAAMYIEKAISYIAENEVVI